MEKETNDFFMGLGIEVDIKSPDNFLKIVETLTRIGVASKKNKTLFQSCHILHKRGRYVIIHFKELFEMDGKPNDFSEDDEARRNTIVNLLEEWGLVEVLEPEYVQTPTAPLSSIKVISFREKSGWRLESKYTIGGKK